MNILDMVEETSAETFNRLPASPPEVTEGYLLQIRPAVADRGPQQVTVDGLILGRDPECDLAIKDRKVSRRHVKVIQRDGYVILEDLGSTNGVLHNGRPLRGQVALQDNDRVQIGSHQFKYLAGDSDESNYHEAVHESLKHDPLTGAQNRRSFNQIMTQAVARRLLHGGELSLVAIDLDHFKSINDYHGHLVGDEVLCQFVKRLVAAVRPQDQLCRFGGEEFLLLINDATAEEAMRVAQRCCCTVAGDPFETSVGPLEVTASFGVANLKLLCATEPMELIAEADQRMYQAKELGRNRVVGPPRG